jgi:hypothetical protein
VLSHEPMSACDKYLRLYNIGVGGLFELNILGSMNTKSNRRDKFPLALINWTLRKYLGLSLFCI